MLKFFTKKKGFTLIELERSKSVRRNESFTLIELLVVIAVIGLIGSVIFVSFGKPQKQANDSRRKVDIKEIMKGMELCYDDTDCGAGADKYPVNNIADQPNAIKNIDTDEIPRYFCPVPIDPSNSGDHMYKWAKNDTVPTKYCVYVKLEAEDKWVAASEQGIKMDLADKPPTTLSTIISCW